MRIVECKMYRVQVPFRRVFKHAAASRAAGDAILVRLRTEAGSIGFGEIQARPYVTGESNDDVWERGGLILAQSLLGRELGDFNDIPRVLQSIASYSQQPSMVGGFDMALYDALDVEVGVDWTSAIGATRTSATTKCLTIGEDYNGDALRKQAIIAKLGRYGVVKLKVSETTKAKRVQDLRAALGAAIKLRLDANGEMNLESAQKLLLSCAECDIESIEEPLDNSNPNLVKELRELHQTTGVAIVADESICTPENVMRYAGEGAYQVVNVRVGKCGGITGAVRVIAAAEEVGMSIVSGTMVGETDVLLHFSSLLLEHVDDLHYVEGIDQSQKLLQERPITKVETMHNARFRWSDECFEKYVVARKIAN